MVKDVGSGCREGRLAVGGACCVQNFQFSKIFGTIHPIFG
jgi:hypothetical protein